MKNFKKLGIAEKRTKILLKNFVKLREIVLNSYRNELAIFLCFVRLRLASASEICKKMKYREKFREISWNFVKSRVIFRENLTWFISQVSWDKSWTPIMQWSAWCPCKNFVTSPKMWKEISWNCKKMAKIRQITHQWHFWRQNRHLWNQTNPNL